MTETPASTPVRYAGFWIRGAAWLIDLVLLIGTNWLIELALGLYAKDSGALWLQITIVVLYVGADFAYFTLGHWKYGKTVGKWVVRVHVESASYEGYPIGRITYLQAVARWFASIASEVLFGCGYFMAMMHPKKRTLHDLVARTVVVRD